jgi:hypothetical protein
LRRLPESDLDWLIVGGSFISRTTDSYASQQISTYLLLAAKIWQPSAVYICAIMIGTLFASKYSLIADCYIQAHKNIPTKGHPLLGANERCMESTQELTTDK